MRRDALGAGLAAVCLWGLAPVATRAAVAHLSPLPLLLIRLAVASLVLLPWAWPVLRRLRPRSAGRLAAAGVLGLVGYNLPVTLGLRWLPAATAGLLLATEPVWVLVLGRLFTGERGGARPWLGSAVALAGVAVLAGPGAIGGAGGDRVLAGAGLVLAGTLSFGAYTIVMRPLKPGVRRDPGDRGLHRRRRRPLPGRDRHAAGGGPGAARPGDLGRARVPGPRQHRRRAAAVERRHPIRWRHPGEPAALP